MKGYVYVEPPALESGRDLKAWVTWASSIWRPSTEGGEVSEGGRVCALLGPTGATHNPSLQPACHGWLRQPAQAAELKTLGHPMRYFPRLAAILA